jgi:hypothetical protein
VSAGWAAAAVRARALARRRIGAAAARRLAASDSLDSALHALTATPYSRGIHPGQPLGDAQHALAASVLWNLRVLAGWLPRGGVLMLRVLAGWFEIANTDELLAAMAGQEPGRTFRIGALATSWPQLEGARTVPGLRSALAASTWGDPGEDSAYAVRIWMRARWAARVGGELEEPAPVWASGAAALLIAGERFAAGRPPPPAVTAAVTGLLGTGVAGAATLDELAASLPGRAAWALAGVHTPADLWRAEARWWARVERDGFQLLREARFNGGPVLGAAAVLAADAWRTRAALEIAARGGGPLEAYDAVA